MKYANDSNGVRITKQRLLLKQILYNLYRIMLSYRIKT